LYISRSLVEIKKSLLEYTFKWLNTKRDVILQCTAIRLQPTSHHLHVNRYT